MKGKIKMKKTNDFENRVLWAVFTVVCTVATAVLWKTAIIQQDAVLLLGYIAMGMTAACGIANTFGKKSEPFFFTKRK